MADSRFKKPKTDIDFDESIDERGKIVGSHSRDALPPRPGNRVRVTEKDDVHFGREGYIRKIYSGKDTVASIVLDPHITDVKFLINPKTRRVHVTMHFSEFEVIGRTIIST